MSKEYGCDYCGRETPDGAGYYVNSDQDRVCAECFHATCHLCGMRIGEKK